MKIKKILVIIIGATILIACSNRESMLVGEWKYSRTSSVNGGKTEITFNFNNDNTCSYNMKYTLLGKTIIDQTNTCTWKMNGEYVTYISDVEEGKLFYDESNGILYTIDKDTNSKEYEMEKQ